MGKKESLFLELKNWQKTFVIAVLVALTSELYWNAFIDGFRISTSVVLFPVLLMTLGSEIHTLQISLGTSITIFFLRMFILITRGTGAAAACYTVFPGAVYYLIYGLLFKAQVRNKHTAGIDLVTAAVLVCDFTANSIEAILRELMLKGCFPAHDVFGRLFLIAVARTVVVIFIMGIIGEYQGLLKKREHEARYQRLFMLLTDLKSEVYLMNKNSKEIERVMGNAYHLYEKMLSMDMPDEMQQMGLDIARDVHEIKKDYIRIIQGIENEIGKEYTEEEMHFKDVLKILEKTGYQIIDSKGLNIKLVFICHDDFLTVEHYTIMALLKNLVSNAVEAMESSRKNGIISISARRVGENFVFKVADTGPGIKKRHLEDIFKMGYSTKFDPKTGNIYRGVGLCGVKNAVEDKYKGTITVESVEGQGTTFYITLPAREVER